MKLEVKSRMHPESPRFYEQVTSKLGGETLTSCYQCGTCVSSCPVAKLTKRFNPRNIIKNALLGNREKLLTDGTIWLCCSCFNCQERCPQKVEIAELIFTLRNIALAEGYAPKAFVDMASSLMSTGRLVPVTKFLMRRREKAGLPPISDTGIEALNKIFSIPSSKVNGVKAKEEVP
jgi:heterodisulfide reductase subunit C